MRNCRCDGASSMALGVSMLPLGAARVKALRPLRGACGGLDPRRAERGSSTKRAKGWSRLRALDGSVGQQGPTVMIAAVQHRHRVFESDDDQVDVGHQGVGGSAMVEISEIAC